MTEKSATQKQKKSSPKKTYHSPTLTVRRPISEVTQGGFPHGSKDGGLGYHHGPHTS